MSLNTLISLIAEKRRVDDDDAEFLVNLLETKSNRVQLNDVVSALGVCLVSTDNALRRVGTWVLVRIIQQCSENVVGPSELALLTAFMMDRIRDTACIAPVMVAVGHLASTNRLAAEHVPQVFRSMTENVRTQSLAQSERQAVYTLLESLLALPNYLDALRPLGVDVVVGFIQLIDGEKDPRNLIGIFRMSLVVMTQFPSFVHFAEDFFDVLAAYFPIRYTPPANDKTVTEEMLRTGLRKCLTAGGPAFAVYAVPMILETLQSPALEAKMEAIRLINDSAYRYEAPVWAEAGNALWSLLRESACEPTNEAQSRESLEAIRVLSDVLFVSNVSTTHSVDEYHGTPPLHVLMVKESARMFREPDFANAASAGRILQTIASANAISCHYVLETALPSLLMRVEEQDVHWSALQIVVNLIRIVAIVCNKLGALETQLPATSLAKHSDLLSVIFNRALAASQPEERAAGSRGLTALCLCSGALNDVGCVAAAERLVSLLVCDRSVEVRKVALACLCKLARHPVAAKSVEAQSVSLLLAVPDAMPSDEGMGVSEALTSLAQLSLFSDTIAVAFTDAAVNHILQGRLPEEYLASLAQVFAGQSITDEFCVDPALPSKMAALLYRRILCDLVEFTKSAVDMHETVVQGIANLCREGMRFLPADLQHPLTVDAVNLLTQVSLPSERRSHVFVVVSAMLLAAHPETLPPVSLQFLQQLQTIVLADESVVTSSQRLASSTVLASLVNKLSVNQGSLVQTYVEQYVLGQLSELLTADTAYGSAAMTLFIWLTKAVIVGGLPSAKGLLQTLLRVILGAHGQQSLQAARGMEVIMADTPHVLAPSLDCVWRILYRQRVFGDCCGSLVEAFWKPESVPEVQAQILCALSHLIQHIPQPVLLADLSRLLPLLLISLGHTDAQVVQQALNTVLMLLKETPEPLYEHAGAMIDRLVILGTKFSQMQVRVSAFQCLSEISTMPASIIYPHKQTVIAKTRSALDDKKRLVRAAAAQCRNLWYLLVGK